MVTLLRRVFWLAVTGGAGFAMWSAWSRRNASIQAGPPEWPPIEPPAGATTAVPSAVDATATDHVADRVADRAATASTAPADLDATDDSSSAAPAGTSVTVPLPGGPPSSGPSSSDPPGGTPIGALAWVESDGGACPSTHPIKANNNSGIFHVPGGRFYNQTRAERCYALAEDAEADGYRRAKS